MLGPSILQFINQTLTRSDPEGDGMPTTTVENVKRTAMKCSLWSEGVLNDTNKGLSFNENKRNFFFSFFLSPQAPIVAEELLFPSRLPRSEMVLGIKMMLCSQSYTYFHS